MQRTALNFIAPVVRQCIDECVRCNEVCLSTIPYCLEQGGHHAEESHIVLLQDCATICRTNADFMLRGSDEHERICESGGGDLPAVRERVRPVVGRRGAMWACAEVVSPVRRLVRAGRDGRRCDARKTQRRESLRLLSPPHLTSMRLRLAFWPPWQR